MTDYIYREEAIAAAVSATALGNSSFRDVNDTVNRLRLIPAADVRPVVHGEWKHKVTSSYAGGGATFCSVCGYGYSDGAFFEVEDFDYCPHCGATMKVDRRDIELL